MPEKGLKLSARGAVEVEVFVSDVEWTKYEVWLYERDGSNAQVIGEGVNTGASTGKFQLPSPPKDLDRALVAWEIAIAADQLAPGKSYAARVTFTQNARPVLDGSFAYSGAMADGSDMILDYVWLNVS